MSARSSRGFMLMTALALAILATLISLGTWQVSRLAWKQDLIRDIGTRTQAAPVDFAEWLNTKEGEDYWPVKVSGQFRHDGERHFFATHRGQSGYFIYTPLETASGTFVFVNRGFVPFDKKNPETRTKGQISGTVTITGLARSVLADKPSWLVPDNDPVKNQFYWKDLSAMSASAGLPESAKVERGFIDASVSATPVSGLPQGGVTLIELPNNHLQYAVTWYGLAATLAVIWSVLAFRHFRPKP